jgi:hypothetical protein
LRTASLPDLIAHAFQADNIGSLGVPTPQSGDLGEVLA